MGAQPIKIRNVLVFLLLAPFPTMVRADALASQSVAAPADASSVRDPFAKGSRY